MITQAILDRLSFEIEIFTSFAFAVFNWGNYRLYRELLSFLHFAGLFFDFFPLSLYRSGLNNIHWLYCHLKFDAPENQFICKRREERSTLAMLVKVDLVNVKVIKCIYTYNFRFIFSHCKTIFFCSLTPQKNRRFFNTISFDKSGSVISPKLRDLFISRTKLLRHQSLPLNQISDHLFSDGKRPC